VSIGLWLTSAGWRSSFAPVRTVEEAKDEDDNRFLECAETAQADFLITGNTRHFPDRWAETIVLTPRAFVDLWRGQVDSD
jgi:predicted nucleic acid-binding protein